MPTKDKPKRRLPDPVTITLPGRDFQPRKADMEREYDMPGADMETVRRAFFRPVDVVKDE